MVDSASAKWLLKKVHKSNPLLLPGKMGISAKNQTNVELVDCCSEDAVTARWSNEGGETQRFSYSITNLRKISLKLIEFLEWQLVQWELDWQRSRHAATWRLSLFRNEFILTALSSSSASSFHFCLVASRRNDCFKMKSSFSLCFDGAVSMCCRRAVQ